MNTITEKFQVLEIWIVLTKLDRLKKYYYYYLYLFLELAKSVDWIYSDVLRSKILRKQ